MKLFFRETGEGMPLIILHGLWGASENWLLVARMLGEQFRVILPDLRNHGQSPHSEAMDYACMSDDIATFIQNLALPEPPAIVGHSMGGKVVMTLLLTQPELVGKAVIVDVAPITYPFDARGEHARVMDFISTCRLSTFSTRTALTEAIREQFQEEHLQQLLLKNVRKTSSGWEWKVNPQALKQHMTGLLGFPEKLPLARYEKEVLFIQGANANYIPDYSCLHPLFPAARLLRVEDSGHWIHAEQPERLAQTIETFLIAP